MTADENFEKLYNENVRAVESYFKKKAPPSEVDDLTQQTFMKIWTFISSNQSARSYKALLLTTAKNVLVDFYRKRSRYISYDELSEVFEISSEESLEKSVEVKMALATLSPDDKIIASMKYEGFTSREIAKVVGISASAVRSRLQKIKSALKASSK